MRLAHDDGRTEPNCCSQANGGQDFGFPPYKMTLWRTAEISEINAAATTVVVKPRT